MWDTIEGGVPTNTPTSLPITTTPNAHTELLQNKHTHRLPVTKITVKSEVVHVELHLRAQWSSTDPGTFTREIGGVYSGEVWWVD